MVSAASQPTALSPLGVRLSRASGASAYGHGRSVAVGSGALAWPAQERSSKECPAAPFLPVASGMINAGRCELEPSELPVGVRAPRPSGRGLS